MYHCLLVNQHRHYPADFFKKNYEPILGSIQEPRADEAKNYFVPADLSLGGEGLGFLYRQKKSANNVVCAARFFTFVLQTKPFGSTRDVPERKGVLDF